MIVNFVTRIQIHFYLEKSKCWKNHRIHILWDVLFRTVTDWTKGGLLSV